MSDLYALFVGHLADRIAGGGDFETPWGAVRQRRERHRGDPGAAEGPGYEVEKIDGKVGMNTRALIGAYQRTNKLKVDCWPTEAVCTLACQSNPLATCAAGLPLSQ